MFSYLVYSRDIVVYIRVWKTFPRLLYLDERCVGENMLCKVKSICDENIKKKMDNQKGYSIFFCLSVFVGMTFCSQFQKIKPAIWLAFLGLKPNVSLAY